MALRCHFAVINHLDNAMFRVTWLYTLEWVDINFHRFTSSFSNRCGYSASTRIRIRCVFKSFHSGDRFQKFAVTVCVFAGYVWTLSVTATKCLRIQTNPDTCGRGLKLTRGVFFVDTVWHNKTLLSFKILFVQCFHERAMQDEFLERERWISSAGKMNFFSGQDDFFQTGAAFISAIY